MAEEEGATISVKLKVHYTFDADHKVNHLSRPPQSYQVDTAPIDDAITIGVIDLRSCLDAVITSSPELTHFHENDFTVYAYDYSEPNTPLVGQGMLSKVLSQDGSSNEAMVTGKITQSVMAKFKKNVEPFLEVKLRLTPIASAFQRGRSGSMSSVTENVPPQWSGFSQVGPVGMERPQSPGDMSRLENVHRTLHEGGTRRDSSSFNTFVWSVNSRPSSRPGTPTQSQQYLPPQPGSTHSRSNSHYPPYQQSHARRGSESGYWSADEIEDGPAKKRARTTRVQKAKKADFNIEQQPNSLRTAAMGASSLRVHQPTPMNPAVALQRGLPTEEPVRPPTPIAKGPTRKPTGRPRGRPRKDRDIETVEPSSPLQKTLREPQLPDSNVSSPDDVRDRQPNESVMSTPADIPSSPPMLPLPQQAVTMTSPGLPENRSPPVRPDGSHDSGFFSAQVDSAQMEGEDFKDNNISNEDDLFGDIEVNPFDGDLAKWFEDLGPPSVGLDQTQNGHNTQDYYTPVFDDESVFEGPTPQPEPQLAGQTPNPQQESQQQTQNSPDPQPIFQATPAPTVVPQPQSQKIPVPVLQPNPQSQANFQPTNEHQFQRPALPVQPNGHHLPVTDKNGRPVPTLLPRPPQAKIMQRSQSMLPPVPASDPGTRQLQRSNTWTQDIMSDAIMSDNPGADDARGKRKRVGKEQTKARLEAAIAAGGMPPYCHNCGAIETPAWRRGYIKVFTCPYDYFQTSLNQGEMCFKQVMERHPDGSVKVWKGWKVEKLQHQTDDWEQINLCNPCGLWFHKNKTPRPAEKWQKKDPKEKRKRKRPPKPPKSRTNPPRAAAGNLTSDTLQSDMQEPPSEDSSPADTSTEDVTDENNDNMTVDGDNNETSQEVELPPMPKSVMSAQIGRRTVRWAEAPDRQAQSSPITRGTAQEPIEVDLTPKPLRRKLFSPGSNQKDEITALIEKKNVSLLPSFVRRSPRLNKIRDVFAESHTSITISADGIDEGEGKENVTPSVPANEDFEDFNDLFGDHQGYEDIMLPPATPTPKRRSERILLRTPGKTPTREFGTEISGNALSTPKGIHSAKVAQDIDVAELFMDTVTRNLGPEFMTPHTRAIFSACSDATSPILKRSRGKTGFTPKAGTPGKSSVEMDFPDLPSLKPSSPLSHNDIGHSFSELPTERLYPNVEDMLNTDAPMPSSPPINVCGGWSMNDDDEFGDMVNFHDFENTNWDFVDEPGSASKLKTPKTPNKNAKDIFLSVDTPGRAGLRRSPRRAKLG